jgi:hypothetical protein
VNFDYIHPDWFRVLVGSNSIDIVLSSVSDACRVNFHFDEAYF